MTPTVESDSPLTQMSVASSATGPSSTVEREASNVQDKDQKTETPTDLLQGLLIGHVQIQGPVVGVCDIIV